MNPYVDAQERAPTQLGQIAGMSKRLQYKIAEIGYRHLTRGRLDKARVIFEGLAQLDPFDAWFQLAVGSVAQRAKNWAKAEAAYSKAIQLKPASVAGYANRGEVRLMAGKTAEGLADLRRAVQLDRRGDDPSAFRARAVLAAAQRK